ncbi:MAG TPA: hypothetical protein VIA62_24685 [Thermoanaerobaculia bacterium]|jgi:hypothetical protein|nr:hypothetical protein [Thermoanaerobaculia bacterium]
MKTILETPRLRLREMSLDDDFVPQHGGLIGGEVSAPCGVSEGLDEIALKYSLLAQDLERFSLAGRYSPATPRDQVLGNVVGRLKQNRQLPNAGIDGVGIR